MLRQKPWLRRSNQANSEPRRKPGARFAGDAPRPPRERRVSVFASENLTEGAIYSRLRKIKWRGPRRSAAPLGRAPPLPRRRLLLRQKPWLRRSNQANSEPPAEAGGSFSRGGAPLFCLGDPLQLRPEGDPSGRFHSVELDHMASQIHVRIQDRPRSEDGVPHPLAHRSAVPSSSAR